MPRVYSEIQKFFEDTLGETQSLGTHLNGDEAMCHGAAFIAANATAARFKVKDIKLIERSPFEYHVNLTSPDGSVKQRRLFSRGTLLGSKKKFSIPGDSELEALVYIRYPKDPEAEIIEDAEPPVPVLTFNFTQPIGYAEKVAALKEKDRFGNATKTILKFELSRSGTVNLLQSDLEYEELREVSKKVKK